MCFAMSFIFLTIFIHAVQVQLRHLQALYHLLEEHAQGGAVANIHANYRVALPEVSLEGTDRGRLEERKKMVLATCAVVGIVLCYSFFAFQMSPR